MADDVANELTIEDQDRKSREDSFGTLRALLAPYAAASAVSMVAKHPTIDQIPLTTAVDSQSVHGIDVLAAACYDECGQLCPEGEECNEAEQCWDPKCVTDACDIPHLQVTACADPECSIPTFDEPCDDPQCENLWDALDTTCYDPACLDSLDLDWSAHEPPQLCPPGSCYGFVPQMQQCMAGSNVQTHHCLHPAILHNQHYDSQQFPASHPFLYHCANHGIHTPNGQHLPHHPLNAYNAVQPRSVAHLSPAASAYEPTHDGRKRRRRSLTTKDGQQQDRSGVRHGRSHSNACLDHAQLDDSFRYPPSVFGTSHNPSFYPLLSPDAQASTGILTPSSISTNLGDHCDHSYRDYLISPQIAAGTNYGYHNAMAYAPLPTALVDSAYQKMTMQPTFTLPIIGGATDMTKEGRSIPCRWLMKDGDDDEESHICGLLFADEKALHEHINETHVPQRTNAYFCGWEGCARPKNDYNHRTKLMRHIKGSHSKWHEFVCTHLLSSNRPCGRTFATKEQLDNHSNTHTGEKPFGCEWPGCTHRSATKTQQTTHYRTHTGEKKYICPVCGHGTGDSSNLSKHVRTKHPEWKGKKRAVVTDTAEGKKGKV